MRINVINPKYLTDQHLIAEYRETKMITYYYVKSSETDSGIDPQRIGERYTLNTGHAYMWYNKFGYIKKRFTLICKEMRARKFKCDYDKLDYTGIPKSAFGNFVPTREDIEVNLDRVLLRINDKPDWYKYKSKPVENWYTFYFDLFEKNSLL